MRTLLSSLLVLGLSSAWALPVRAQASYGTSSGWEVKLPSDPDAQLSYWTSAAGFPPATSRYVDGYWLAGRLLAAHGKQLFLQETFGQSRFAVVGTVEVDQDPSFIKISPDGEWIAMGLGWGQPLFVVPTSILSIENPPHLATHPAVLRFEANYYDAEWRDSRYLLINAGWFTGSAIYVLDTQTPDAEPVELITAIPGASGGVTVDRDGNVITGIGLGMGGTTGQLRIFPASAIDDAIADGEEPLAYTTEGVLLANNVLSAAHLAVDAQGNLLVGGGDAFGGSGDMGYAGLVTARVLERVLTGGEPMDPAEAEDFVQLVPDACMNDMAVTVVYVPGVEMALISANFTTVYPDCGGPEWTSGAATVVALFQPGAPDDDGDGTPNGVDEDYAPRAFLDRSYFSRFVELFGTDVSDTQYDASFDLDGDDDIDWDDFAQVRDAWGSPRWQ